jgi:hypothetical protein
LTRTERDTKIRALHIAYEIQAQLYERVRETSFEQQLRFWYDHLDHLYITPNAIGMVAFVDDEALDKILRFEIDIRSDKGIKEVLHMKGDNLVGLWMVGNHGKGLIKDIRSFGCKTYTRLTPYAKKKVSHYHLRTAEGITKCQHQILSPKIDLSQILTQEPRLLELQL